MKVKIRKKFLKTDFLFIFLSVILSLLLYLPVLKGFFQQDEWMGYSDFIVLSGLNTPRLIREYFIPVSGLTHYMPLNYLLVHFLFSFFGLCYKSFSIISIFLHLIVIFLSYIFFHKLFDKKMNINSAIILFLVLASGYQGVAWVVADLGTHFAFIFALLSLIFYFDFLSNDKIKFQILSSIFLVISILFKETALGFFPMYFIYYVLQKKQGIIQSIGKLKFLFVPFVVYCFYRGLFIFLIHNYAFYGSLGGEINVSKAIYNLLTLPVKALTQTIIPSKFLYDFSQFITKFLPDRITGVYGSPEFDFFATKRVLELINLLLPGIFIFLIFKAKKHTKNKNWNLAIFSLLYILFGSILVSIAPEKNSIVTFIDSRYLYFLNVGGVVLLIYLLSGITKKIYLLIFILFFSINYIYLKLDLKQFVTRGEIRSKVLERIANLHFNLPSKVVFYTESDVSYYGLPEDVKILPFQSGFGQTLLAWYYSKEKFPKKFFEDRFLWEIDSQGYKEIDGIGFGYFRDFNLLKDTVTKYNIPRESVIAFSWNGNNKALINISEEIQEELFK